MEVLLQKRYIPCLASLGLFYCFDNKPLICARFVKRRLKRAPETIKVSLDGPYTVKFVNLRYNTNGRWCYITYELRSFLLDNKIPFCEKISFDIQEIKE